MYIVAGAAINVPRSPQLIHGAPQSRGGAAVSRRLPQLERGGEAMDEETARRELLAKTASRFASDICPRARYCYNLLPCCGLLWYKTGIWGLNVFIACRLMFFLGEICSLYTLFFTPKTYFYGP